MPIVHDDHDLMSELGCLEIWEWLLANGLASSFDRPVVVERTLTRVYVRLVRGVGVSPTLSALPEPKAPPPKPPRWGQCKVYPYTACISLRCHEDGFCRQTGEEIITAC